MGLLPSDAVEDEPTSGTEAAQEAVEDHAAAEGAEGAADSVGGLGSKSGLRDALLETEPAPPLEAVESPWAPEKGGPTRMMRAAQKMTGATGLPAIVDLAIGVAETVVAFEPDGGDSDDGGDSESSTSSSAGRRPTTGSSGLSADDLEAGA